MRRALFSSALLLVAAPANAASEGGSGDFLFQVLNFALLLVVLVVVARKPVQAYFRDRREDIMSSLSEATELQRRAEENYARWQRQLVELDQQIEQIRTTAQERAERESTQILADAQATAERIKRDASAGIESELRRAQARLRAETSELAVELAAGILREQVTDEDRGRLVDEFISRIETAPAPGASNGSSS
jgi:F-type H+-transporting ATPase subunit b